MKRSLQFEALEHRVVMSAGGFHPAVVAPSRGLTPIEGNHMDAASAERLDVRAGTSTVPAHPNVALAAKRSAPIKGKLSGGQSSLIGDTNYVAMEGFSGKLGKVSLQATIYGQVSGNSFEGGSLRLFNSQGVIISDLGPGTLKKSGKNEDLKVEFIFEEASGPYTQAAGSAGTLTIELKTQKSATKTAAPELSRLLDWSGDFVTLEIILSSYGQLALGLFGR
jgi:hypothetical protein